MKNRGTVLTPEILMSAYKQAEDNFGQPSQFIVNPNVDFSVLNEPTPKKTPEEIEHEKVEYAMELMDLMQKLKYSFEFYTIEHSEEYGYFITAKTFGGQTVKNDYNFYDDYSYDLNTAIKDLLEKIK